MTVTASAEMEYNLTLDLPSELKGCLTSGYSDLAFSMPAERAVAPSIKARGRLAILGTLVTPYIEKEDTHDTASLDDPYEVHTYRLIAHLKPDQIAVIGANGEIVWKCIPGRYNPSPTPTPIKDSMAMVERLGYPVRLIRERTTGTVEAVLEIGPDGKASNCKVTVSSGNPDLDSATCPGLVEYAKFTPAADIEGNPISGEYTARINWKFPY